MVLTEGVFDLIKLILLFPLLSDFGFLVGPESVVNWLFSGFFFSMLVFVVKEGY